MKIIDAYWDTRSLQKRTAEVVVEKGDRLKEVSSALEGLHGYEYIVVKTEVGQQDLSSLLAQRGFTFAECSLEVLLNLRMYEMPELARRHAGDIRYRRATDDSKGIIYKQIGKDIFDTDRVALDRCFPKGISAIRYRNWIEDELSRGSDLYHVFFRDEEVGFFVMKETIPGVEANPFLASLYDGFKSSGLGMNVVVGVEIEEAKRRGMRRLRTHVSSNNVAVLNLYEFMGYHVSHVQNVFTKHAEPSNRESLVADGACV